ncbi:hypothetical protein PENTCL1PPCAC_22577, partial [Pristionchus entomophagus]
FIKMINYDDCIGREKKCVIDSTCFLSTNGQSPTPKLAVINEYEPEALQQNVACSGFTVKQITRLSYELEMQGRGEVYLLIPGGIKIGCYFPTTTDDGNRGDVDLGFFASPLGRVEGYQVNENVPNPYNDKKVPIQFNYCRFSVQTYGEDLLYDLFEFGPTFHSSKDFPAGLDIANRTLGE